MPPKVNRRSAAPKAPPAEIGGGNFKLSHYTLVGNLAEMHVQMVSTRKVKAVTEALCGHSFSASAI